MASIQEQVISLLNADAGVQGSFGFVLNGVQTTRIYPDVLPQEVLRGTGTPYPAAVYQIVTDIPVNSLDGYAYLNNARLQIDVYATNYGAADVAAKTIVTVLRSVVPVFGTGPQFSSVQLARRDLYEAETRLHRVNLEFSIWRNET